MMNMLPFIVSLVAVLVISQVTATNIGFGGFFPVLSYPSSGLWTRGWVGDYNRGSGFGRFRFPSSYGYLPKGIKNPAPLFSEGGYGGVKGFGNGGLIYILVIFLVLIGTIWTNTTRTPKNDIIISIL